jgi:hypothetical protein
MGEKMSGKISRRGLVAKSVLLSVLCGAGLMLQAADYGHARDLVARVQGDLQRAAEFTRAKEKERVRYENVQHHLSDFDRELSKDHFDKGKLDTAIDDLKNVAKNNTLESHDRDALNMDLSDLRTLRDLR